MKKALLSIIAVLFFASCTTYNYAYINDQSLPLETTTTQTTLTITNEQGDTLWTYNGLVRNGYIRHKHVGYNKIRYQSVNGALSDVCYDSKWNLHRCDQ